jgi:hypothetical protein
MNNKPLPIINLSEQSVFSFEPFKNPNPPDRYVYHYTSWERMLDILHTGFRMGTLATMNDPRESKDWFLGVNREAERAFDGAAFNRAIASYKSKLRVG